MIEDLIAEKTVEAIVDLYLQHITKDQVQIEKTNREFSGDFTLIVFPFSKYSHKSAPETAREIGNYLMSYLKEIDDFTVVKGFLNLSVTSGYWMDFFRKNIGNESFGLNKDKEKGTIVLEYSSPNTNKPLHLGHIRNNLLGFSIAEILKANGKKVVRINLINDRGIHICKSMLAWMKWGQGETPESTGMKGDQLVGKYYVKFDQKHKEQIEELVHSGHTEEDAYSKAPLMVEAKELLKKWEDAEEDVLQIWHTMNDWAYGGFNKTYERLGVEFDEINLESKVYREGRDRVLEGLENGVFYEKEDKSVWVDLTDEGLDHKLLLRSDGTSVYITQDIGTAERRYLTYHPDRMIYVVGNEQIYHFEVLKKILKKLGRPWYDHIIHLSYGMVELPHGRMKSREGKVVDADDLMDEMHSTAKRITEELGKTEGFSPDESEKLYEMVGMGALKYFILKVDPKKNMLFNPEESIDFNGNTGSFIQYTYARIQSIFRKAGKSPDKFVQKINYQKVSLTRIEREIISLLHNFPQVVVQAGEQYSPAVVANYCYDLVKLYNHYYQDTPILKRVDEETAYFRVSLSWFTGKVIKQAMSLLGINLPDKM